MRPTHKLLLALTILGLLATATLVATSATGILQQDRKATHHDRAAKFCADHPDNDRCQKLAAKRDTCRNDATDRCQAHHDRPHPCRADPESERCQAIKEKHAERKRAHCADHPDDARCQHPR